MLIFKRILNFDKKAVAERAQRRDVRHPVEPGSPLHMTIRSGQHDEPVKLLNLSSGGAAIERGPQDTHRPHDACQVRLGLGKRSLRLDAVVVHLLGETTRTKLGLEFRFANLDEQKSYLQLLEPVAIGASLRLGNPKLVRERETGLLTKQYVGPGDTLLTVWRHFSGQAVHSFEFRMHDYFVRSSSTPRVLEVYTCEASAPEQQPGYEVPALKRATDQSAEIRQLFLWVVPHLSQAVPDDIREYLASFTD